MQQYRRVVATEVTYTRRLQAEKYMQRARWLAKKVRKKSQVKAR